MCVVFNINNGALQLSEEVAESFLRIPKPYPPRPQATNKPIHSIFENIFVDSQAG